MKSFLTNSTVLLSYQVIFTPPQKSRSRGPFVLFHPVLKKQTKQNKTENGTKKQNKRKQNIIS